VNQYEHDAIKKLVIGSMGMEGAELVTGYLDKLAKTVSGFQQICMNQDKMLRGLAEKVIIS